MRPKRTQRSVKLDPTGAARIRSPRIVNGTEALVLSFRTVVSTVVGIGVLALPASAFGEGWVYGETGAGTAGDNSVLALEYGKDGSLPPVNIREYPTRGTGFTLVDGKSFGSIAGDQQVLL